MDTVDSHPAPDKFNAEQSDPSLQTPTESLSREADIRALLLDETHPDLELLHNLIMMC